MSRLVNASVETAIAQPHVICGLFVDLDFTSGHFRAFNGTGEQTYNGQSYYGLGQFGGVSKISERIDARDFTPLTLGLSGVPADLFIEDVPDRPEYFGRSATIYFVLFDESTMQPLPVEAPVFEGFMDKLTFQRRGAVADVQVTIKHHTDVWNQSIGLLYTHEHQRLIDNTDDGLNQVHTVETLEVVWGGGVWRGGSFAGNPELWRINVRPH